MAKKIAKHLKRDLKNVDKWGAVQYDEGRFVCTG